MTISYMVTFINLISIYGSPHKTITVNFWLTLSQNIFGRWGYQNATAENYVFFNPIWYENHATTIYSILLITPFVPYMMALLSHLVCNKCCCCKCCKKERGIFLINQKTIYLISTITIIFITGFGRIDFFFAGLISFALQFFLDRIYITYWYKPIPILSDPTNNTTMTLLKYAPCLYMFLGFFVFT